MISSELADTIEMLRGSAEGIADPRDLGRIRALRFTELGFDRSVWNDICALGWTALPVSEDKGGLGLGLLAGCALAETAGRALMPEPLVAAWLSASLLDGQWLNEHLAGQALVMPAWQSERNARAPSVDIGLRNGKLFGTKRYVGAARAASAFLVIDTDKAWLIDPQSEGVSLEVADTQDGGHIAALVLDGATGEPVVPASGRIDQTFAAMTLFTAAYLLGVIDATLERTIDYLRTRHQFGKPIGSFQVLQHRAVDLRLQLELTRASVEDAALRWDSLPNSATALAAISRAKARATAAAILVTRQAIQLHGGVGYADEHDIGLFLRKAMVVAPQFGTADLHKRRFLSQSRCVEENIA